MELVLEQVTDLGLEIFLKVVYFGSTKDYAVDKFMDLYTFAHTYGMPEIEGRALKIMRSAAVGDSFILLENCSQYLEEFKEINSLKKTLLTKRFLLILMLFVKVNILLNYQLKT